MTLKGRSGPLELGFCATLGWNKVQVVSGTTPDLNAQAALVEAEFFPAELVRTLGFCIQFKLPIA